MDECLGIDLPVNGGNGVPISLGGERQAGCSEPRCKSWITEYPAQCLGESRL